MQRINYQWSGLENVKDVLRLARWARRLVRRWRGSLIGATPENFGRDLGPVTRIVGHPLYLVGVNTVWPLSSCHHLLPLNFRKIYAALFSVSVSKQTIVLVLAAVLWCPHTNESSDRGTRHRYCFIVVQCLCHS